MLKSGVPVNSMGRRRRWVEDKLGDGWDVRLEHLLKLYFYPEETRYHGVWMTSVFSSAREVKRFMRNKLPGYKFLFNALWLIEDPLDIKERLNMYVDTIARKMPALRAPRLPMDSVVADDCMRYMEAYHVWLCGRLSKFGYVIAVDVEHKLKELLSQSIYHK